MLTYLYIEPFPFLEPERNIFAHHGMAESAGALLPLVTKVITDIRQNEMLLHSSKSSWWTSRFKKTESIESSSYRVVITGHSLGAGTACLLSILLAHKSNISSEVFAFAPPPVISNMDLLAEAVANNSTNNNFNQRMKMKWKSLWNNIKKIKKQQQQQATFKIHAFVHNNDIISRGSHTEIISLLSAILSIDELKWNAIDKSLMLLFNHKFLKIESRL
jgi:esterase/lipase